MLALHRFKIRKVMGDTLRLNDTMRALEAEVGKMTQPGGMYSDEANGKAFKETDIYKDMQVAAPTVKTRLVGAVMRWFRNTVTKNMSTKIAEKYADNVRDLEAKVAEMNKMMTGSDAVAPQHEELVRYEQMHNLTLSVLKTHRKLTKKTGAIDKMVTKKTAEMFTNLDDSDDDIDKASS